MNDKTFWGGCVALCIISALLSVTIVSTIKSVYEDIYKTDSSNCNSLVYAVYGNVETVEHAENLSVVAGNVSYENDGITFYIKPDMLAVKEHTHE